MKKVMIYPKNRQNGRLLAAEGTSFGRSSTGVSPRPMLMGAAHNALRAFNARVSLTLPVRHRPQAATLALRPGVLRSSVSSGPVLRTCNRFHGALAVWLGTDRNVSVCLILHRWPPSGLSFSRCGKYRAERGTHGGHPNQVMSKSRIAIINLVSSLRRRSSSTRA